MDYNTHTRALDGTRNQQIIYIDGHGQSHKHTLSFYTGTKDGSSVAD